MHIVPRACTTGYSTSMHAVSLTSETNGLHGDMHTRVSVQKIFLDMIVEWHHENSAACEAAHQQSKAWALTSTGHDILTIRETYVGKDTPERVRLEGYQLIEPIPQRLVDGHGIIVDDNDFVTMNQLARMVIPQILDPAAMDRQVEAVRVYRPGPDPVPVGPRVPLPRRKLLGYQVRVGGRTRDVMGMKIKVGGRTRDVIMP